MLGLVTEGVLVIVRYVPVIYVHTHHDNTNHVLHPVVGQATCPVDPHAIQTTPD